MSIRRLATALIGLGLATTALAPAVVAAEPLTLTTPYPAVVVAPGAHVSFNVSVATTGAERVALTLAGAPSGWEATLHGGGFVVDAVQTDGTNPATVRVDVTVPADATGSGTIVLTAASASATAALTLSIRVEASVGGDVTLKTDFPSLRGPASQTFSFNLTLANQSAEDLTFAVNAQGPAGWDIQAKLTGQSQAASAIIKAGSTSGITVTALAPVGVAAGTYPIHVVATAGARSIEGDLQVEVTGSYALGVSTVDGRLNGHGSAGSTTDLSLLVTNTGTAPITNVQLSATAPSGWKTSFEPATIESLAPDVPATVTVHLVPSTDAIAGDYVVSIKATGDQSTNASSDIRFTVETSLVFGLVGALLIVGVFAGLWAVFQRYGRR